MTQTMSFTLAAVTAVVCAASHAQTPATGPAYPAKPIRLVVGFPPGGSNDIVARLIAPKLTQLLGAQMIVENRAGANATIGTDLVAKSPPDGYTLTLGSASPLAISPFTYPNIPYDTLRDFAAITTVASTPELLGIHPSLPARNLKELVALAKSQPGKLDFASSGNGGLAAPRDRTVQEDRQRERRSRSVQGRRARAHGPARRSRARDDHRSCPFCYRM